ncbi:MAG: C39 family peptidase, partial [Flavobacteriaceae bacterium]|nr:C39 family peptidase [Flavobacteriaceae bacterium]
MESKNLRADGELKSLPKIILDFAEKLHNKEFKLAATKIKEFIDSNDFIDSCLCHVEYPYVDAQYRDSFYFYHSFKNLHKEKECIRVSLFKKKYLSDDSFFTIKKNSSNNFLGIFVIRPTKLKQIGRMVLSPYSFNLPPIDIISRKFVFSINGISITVDAFQNSGQDGEFYSCAETSLMSLSSYFSKYDDFNNQLPSNIHRLIDKVRVEKITSGVGLKQHEISYALKQFGFGTKMYLRNKDTKSTDFKNAFNDYIESGIPVLATVSSTKDENHSVLCIGFKNENEKKKRISSRNKNFTDIITDIITSDSLFESEREYI